jgi:uncharacterized membrane protein
MLSATFSRLRHTDKMLQQRVSRNVNEEQDKRMTIADRAADVIAEFAAAGNSFSPPWELLSPGSFLIPGS